MMWTSAWIPSTSDIEQWLSEMLIAFECGFGSTTALKLPQSSWQIVIIHVDVRTHDAIGLVWMQRSKMYYYYKLTNTSAKPRAHARCATVFLERRTNVCVWQRREMRARDRTMRFVVRCTIAISIQLHTSRWWDGSLCVVREQQFSICGVSACVMRTHAMRYWMLILVSGWVV